MKKYLKILLILICAYFSVGFSYPKLLEDSKSYLIMDLDDGRIVEEANIDEQVAIASISKLMTYLLVEEAVESGRLKHSFKYKATREDIRGGSGLGLVVGKEYTLDELVKPLLIVSDNSSAAMLARLVSGSEKNFAILMNNKAKEIELEKYHFLNATGLPEGRNGVQNTMSTRDLSKLIKYILDTQPEIKNITKIKEYNGHKNTNPLLENEFIEGLKTGYTNKSKFCLAWIFNNSEKQILSENEIPINLTIINMGFKDRSIRDYNLNLLYNYIKNNYKKYKVLDRNVSLNQYLENDIFYGLKVFPKEDFSYIFKNGEKYEIHVELNGSDLFPIINNINLGKVKVYEKSKEIELFSTDLVFENNFFGSIIATLRGILNIY